MALSQGSKRFLIVLAILAGLVVVGIGGGVWWVNQQMAGEPGEGEPVALTVDQGASGASIATMLEEAGVVRNALAFRLVARSRGVASRIQAGDYEFRTGMSVDEAIEVLEGGPAERTAYRVTIPEGLTVAQTLERLADQTPYDVADYRAILDERLRADSDEEGLLDLPDWVPALSGFGPGVREPYEGLLFPQTHDFFEEATAQQILQRLVDELDRVVAGIGEDEIAAAEDAGLSLYQALVLASLVEREAQVEDERPLIAGVIRNRLDEGMLLQIDASVLYAQDEAGSDARVNTDIDSPYNTYKYPGLPPTPISGSRSSAIQAAISPEQTEFLYYVVKAPECDGTHKFARTLDEHNNNVAAYRNAGRCEEE